MSQCSKGYHEYQPVDSENRSEDINSDDWYVYYECKLCQYGEWTNE